MSKVLILGAGFVCGPALGHLVGRLGEEIKEITVAAAIESDIERLRKTVTRTNNISFVQLDILRDVDELRLLIKSSSIVLCLLPNVLIPNIVDLCVELGTHMVHASYTTDGIRALDERARKGGVIIMNEAGLDPGIDHMLAMRTIDEIKILSFSSHCGGVPSPAHAKDNVLNYKFSWSPIGVMRSITQVAKFMRDGTLITVEDVLSNEYITSIECSGVELPLVTMPNRDATVYAAKYNIEQDLRSIYRGTVRYENGFIDVMAALKSIGMLSDCPFEEPKPSSWLEVMAKCLGVEVGDVEGAARNIFGQFYEGLKTLGLFSPTPLAVQSSPMETLAMHLSQQSAMQYSEGQTDMTVMVNEVDEGEKGEKESVRRHRMCMVVHGDAKYSAMAKTVGWTAAIMVQLIANGTLTEPGIHIPTSRVVYEPALTILEEMGIAFTSSDTIVDKSN